VSGADFDDRFPSHFRVSRPPANNSPVTAAPRAITVALPDDMAPAQFDHEFDEAVRTAAIDEWVTDLRRSRSARPYASPQRFAPFTEDQQCPKTTLTTMDSHANRARSAREQSV
jgi:hypothetical protein